MRYSLELAALPSLTQTGLDSLSDKLFSQYNTITPMSFDKTILNGLTFTDNSKLLRGFKRLRTLNKDYIASGKSNTPVTINSFIESASSVVSVLDANELFINDSKISISDTDFLDTISIEENGYLVYDLTNFKDSFVYVFTLASDYLNGSRVKKQWNFVAWKDSPLGTTSPKATFRQETTPYQYTIKNNKLYLNTKVKDLTYKDESISIADVAAKKVYYLSEFPVKASGFRVDGLDSGVTKSTTSVSDNLLGGYFYLNTEQSPMTQNLIYSGIVSPIILVKRNIGRTNKYIGNLDLNYSSSGFLNGLIVLNNRFAAPKIPRTLTINSTKSSDKGVSLVSNDIAKIKVSLLDAINTPVKNKSVTISITQGSATFISNGQTSITLSTSNIGSAETLIKNTVTSRYVQLTEIDTTKKILTIPSRLKILSPSEVYLYFVLNDDPLLYSASDTSIGRKIAYIDFSNENGLTVSRFVKPVSVVNSDGNTVITYSSALLSDSKIKSCWLLWNEEIKVSASYSDNLVSLSSNEISFLTKYMKSEDAFMISDTKIQEAATSFNDYSYLTTSEYFKNPFSLFSYSYLCTNSDCINRKCISPINSYRENFIWDSSISGCQHTPNNEANVKLNIPKCPGLQAQFLNPFIMPLKQIIE